MINNKVSKCPLCNRRVSDILKHFSITHEIASMNQLKEKLEQASRKLSRQTDFSRYVDKLKEQEAKGLISAEDYRRLITEWTKEH